MRRWMTREPRSLSGKVVAITGGARGIGHATARALTQHGARVAIGDLDGDLAEQVAAGLGGGAFGVGVDVTDNAAFTAFLDGVEHRLGPLDVLVNNAGIMNAGPIDAEDEAMTARAIAINLEAVIHGTREAVQRMKPRRTGHIVNVSSAVSKVAGSDCATYVATKFGVAGFSEAVAIELRGTGVELSVVRPSLCHTDLTSGFGGLRGDAVHRARGRRRADRRDAPAATLRRAGAQEHGADVVAQPGPPVPR